MLQSPRADSPFCEGIEVRFADSSLKSSCCSKILLGSVDFVIEVEGVKPDDFTTTSTFKCFIKEVSLVFLTPQGRVQEVTQPDLFSLHYRL